MQLAVYDLVGALFAPSDPRPITRPTGKLFARICGVIKDGSSDPDFGPVEVAAKAGISLRYLQNLFTERGSTCSEFIYSLRLDQAARLLRRRALMGTGQPLSEIAYACGFRDYAHFARKFRHRFGKPRRAPTPDRVKVPLMEQCALVLSKVRRRLTTFELLRPRFDLRDGNPVRKLRPEVGKGFID